AAAVVTSGLAFAQRAAEGGRGAVVERRVFAEPESLDRVIDGSADAWKDGALARRMEAWQALDARPLAALRRAGYLLVGRHQGLLPFFPFVGVAFAMFIGGPRDRPRWLLLAALVGALGWMALERADASSLPLPDLG